MDPHVSSPAPQRRLLRAVLRAVLLVGGVVIAWLVLSAAPAQADGSASVGVGSSSRPVVEAVQAPAHPSVAQHSSTDATSAVHKRSQAVSSVVRQLPDRTDQAVATTTATAPEPVRATVAGVSGALAPSLSTATEALADTVDRASAAAADVVDPVLTAVGATSSLPSPVGLAPSQGDGMAPVADMLLELGPGFASVGVDQARSMVTQAIESLDLTNLGTGFSLPDAPLLPGSSTGGWSGAAAALVALALMLPFAGRRRLLRPRAQLPLGPAYPPGSSPD